MCGKLAIRLHNPARALYQRSVHKQRVGIKILNAYPGPFRAVSSLVSDVTLILRSQRRLNGGRGCCFHADVCFYLPLPETTIIRHQLSERYLGGGVSH